MWNHVNIGFAENLLCAWGTGKSRAFLKQNCLRQDSGSTEISLAFGPISSASYQTLKFICSFPMILIHSLKLSTPDFVCIVVQVGKSLALNAQKIKKMILSKFLFFQYFLDNFNLVVGYPLVYIYSVVCTTYVYLEYQKHPALLRVFVFCSL